MRTYRIHLLTVLCVAVATVSCVSRSEELDLSQEFSRDIRLADEKMSLPIGDFGKFYLDSLISINEEDPDGAIQVLPGGVYGLRKSGSIEPVSVTLKKMSVHLDDIMLKSIDLDFPDLPVGAIAGAIDIPLPISYRTLVSDTASLSVNENIDDAVLALGELALEGGHLVSVDFAFSAVPSCIDSVKFDGFSFVFPAFFEIGYAGSDSRISVSGNVLTVNRTVSGAELRANGNALSIDGLFLKSFRFSPAVRTVANGNGRSLVLNDEIVCRGYVTAYVGGMVIENPGHISMRPMLNMGDFEVRSFRGKALRKFEKVSESIAVSLDEDLEFLKSAGNSFSFSDISVSADLTSNIAVPLDVETVFSSFKSDGQRICDDIKSGFTLPAAAANGEQRTTRVIFSNAPQSVMRGEISVPVSGIGGLVRQIPDNISIELCAETDTTSSEHFVEFGRRYEISGGYEVLVPFKFDAINLGYSKRIDVNVEDNSFIDISEDVSAVMTLTTAVVNTIPLNLEIGIVAVDKDGRAISDKFTFSNVAVEAGTLDKPSQTEVQLKSVVSSACLSELAGLELSVTASDNGHDGVVLNKNEYFEFRNTVISIDDVDVVIK